MNGFLWNVLLAVIWVAISGKIDPGNLLLGFALGFLVMFVAGRVIGSANYAPRLLQAFELVAFFLWDLLLSNFAVAMDVLRPRPHLRPGVLAVPLDARTDAEITLLAALVALTPGSLSLDVSADRQTLYVHLMHLDDPEAATHKIKNGYERRIMAVMQ